MECGQHRALSDELLDKCLSWLTLAELPACASVCWQWKQEFAVAFPDLLPWHCGAATVCEVPVSPPRSACEAARVRRSCGHISAIGGGRFVALDLDVSDIAVRTFVVDGSRRQRSAGIVERPDSAGNARARRAEESLDVEVEELARRHFRRCRFLCGSSVGGVVGHTDDGSIVFFPAASPDGEVMPEVAREVGPGYQNVLHCGEQVFLLHPGGLWEAECVPADVHHFAQGGWLRVDIACMRNALRSLAAGEAIGRQAVSATRHHFLIHLSVASGAKLAAAVRLPNAASGAKNINAIDWAEVSLSFCERWPPDHPIAQLHNPQEHPADDALLLHGDWEPEGVQVCLLHAATGRVQSQCLRRPGRTGAALRSFEERGIGALAVVASTGLICGCGTAPARLVPPPVVLWDLQTGLVLAEFDLGGPGPSVPPPLPERDPRGDDCERIGDQRHGLRFQVGEHVECRTNSGWVAGQIIACHYRESSWPLGEFAPYQIECDDGSLLYAPEDVARLVRRHVAGHRYEDSFEAQIAICTSTKQVLLGLFHQAQPRSKLYLVSCGR